MIREETYSESTLLKEIAAGNESAFTALFTRYKFRLFGFMYRLTESVEVAEDVVQDVFLKLWQHRETLDSIENIEAYLFRMARNTALNSFKKMARETLVLAELKQEIKPLAATEDLVAARETQRILQETIAALPERQRQVYLLSREHGMKHEQIARELGISPGTVKNHIIQALKTIRNRFNLDTGHPLLVIGFLSIVAAFEK